MTCSHYWIPIYYPAEAEWAEKVLKVTRHVAKCSMCGELKPDAGTEQEWTMQMVNRWPQVPGGTVVVAADDYDMLHRALERIADGRHGDLMCWQIAKAALTHVDGTGKQT